MKKILVVDDDVNYVKAYKRLMRRWNYDVDVAYNGIEAMKKIHEYKPDLVILDINMPGGSGDDLFDLLSMSTSTRAIPVIFVSGMDYESLDMGLSYVEKENFFSKPFDESLLHSRIEELVSK